MKTLLTLLLASLLMSSAPGQTPAAVATPNDTAPQPAAPVGIIILKAVAGYDAAAVSFVSIQWGNTDGGYVVDAAGAKTPFLNTAIGRIIYFDEAYYDEVNHNQYWIEWRAGLQNREVYVTPIETIRLTPRDIPRLQAEQATLVDIIQRYPPGQAAVQPMIDALKDQCAKLGSGLVLQNGQWIPANKADAATSEVTPVIGEGNQTVSFTTKEGKRFTNARVMVTANGVSVITADGGASLSFEQMPDDLTGFAPTAQVKIRAGQSRMKAAKLAAATPEPEQAAEPETSTTTTGTTTATSTASGGPAKTKAHSAAPATLWETVVSSVTSIWTTVKNTFSSAPPPAAPTTNAAPVVPAPVKPAPAPAPAAPPPSTPAPTLPAVKPAAAAPAPSAATPTPAVTPPAAPVPPPVATLSFNAVVIIKGDNAEGTGFLAHTAKGPVVITNLHVIAGNPNFHILTSSGQEVETQGMQGASDRDIAIFSIVDKNYTYLDLAPNVEQSVTVGDPTIIPGNSEGGEVTLKTNGKVVGIGPQLVEFDNPIYHGNSGGPVFDVKTGKVVAVVVAATRMDPKNDIDKASFSNANSAIKGPMRYFGYRLDTVPAWQTYDPSLFLSETLFLKNFHELSRALDSFMNGAGYGNAASSDEGPPDAHYYLTNQKVKKAAENYQATLKDHDKITAVQELVWDFGTLVDQDLDSVADIRRFYPYDQDRAKFEFTYRKALKDEIEKARDFVNNARSGSTIKPGL